MANSNSLVINRELIKSLRFTETLLLLIGSVIFQFIIHLIPPVNGIPLGKILLVAFYAPVIAIIFFKLHVGLITAIAGPFINYLITGAPKPEILAALTIEVVVFTLIFSILTNYTELKGIGALISVIAAMLFSFLLLPVIDETLFLNVNLPGLMYSVLPGIVLITSLSVVLFRYKNK